MSTIDQALASRRDFESELITRATKDDAFRQRLLDNPKLVLQEQLGSGATLPDDLDVKVVEEQAGTFYLVLPPRQVETGELSDADLEKVAGGTGVLTLSCSLIACTC